MGNSNLFQTLSERFMKLRNIFAIDKQISYIGISTIYVSSVITDKYFKSYKKSLEGGAKSSIF